jgi:hypothetical protein
MPSWSVDSRRYFFVVTATSFVGKQSHCGRESNEKIERERQSALLVVLTAQFV